MDRKWLHNSLPNQQQWSEIKLTLYRIIAVGEKEETSYVIGIAGVYKKNWIVVRVHGTLEIWIFRKARFSHKINMQLLRDKLTQLEYANLLHKISDIIFPRQKTFWTLAHQTRHSSSYLIYSQTSFFHLSLFCNFLAKYFITFCWQTAQPAAKVLLLTGIFHLIIDFTGAMNFRII